ncbi:ATP-grasp fold amidoligase family protein [Priestia megaterium]|uniref:ATP-grasp fold amidoligase family protein n=1 Tax=Priestia megaterium TaxID=1404 RepID=UPI000EF9E83C|nr:ATP-grasp fold amidoligase family protein [Priestia megaterium]RMA94440.1 teichuronopeptide biosynthesis TupA-like protein [Priestia megaterium]
MKVLLKSIIKKSNLAVNLNAEMKNVYYKHFVTEEDFIRKRFKERVGREVNLKEPKKYNDKLQWLKLNWYDPLATICADKYAVRQFITDRIGENYLNKIYGVYESVDQININTLPDSFVLKGTHGSGFNIVCKDKSKVDWNKEFKKMRRWLNTNYYLQNKEWVYKDIKPRIICEQFMKQDDGDELRDYRIFCFNGEPKFITVDFSINDKNHTRRNLYDLEWNLMDKEISYPRELKIQVDKPKKLGEMITLSKKLASGFPHARIDFYYIKGKVIFGEITFFHQSGMGKIKPVEFEEKMGSWLQLSKFQPEN